MSVKHRALLSMPYCAAVVAAAIVSSLPAAAGAPPMVLDHITVENGLSQSTVMDVLQDSQGFMWFATEDGLNRWDGYDIRRYTRDRSDPTTLGSDFIWEIEEDALGNLWLATKGGGVVRWDRGADTFSSYVHDPADARTLSSNIARALLIDRDGSIWVGTRRDGVNVLDPASGAVRRLASGSEPGASAVFVLASTARGHVWAGTDGGLLRYAPDGTMDARYAHDPDDPRSLSDNGVRAVYEDRDGTLWVGTVRGLNRLDADGGFTRFVHDPADAGSISADHVKTIFEDDRRRLWLGTRDGLNLLERDSGSFTRYREDPADFRSLSDSHILSIYQDRGGIIWFGTREGGVNRWNPRSWSLGHYKEAWIADVGATSFADDGSGHVWIGTPGAGLARMNLATREVTAWRKDGPPGQRLSDDRVMSLRLDRQGALWIGTMTGGLNRLDTATGEMTVYRADPEAPGAITADGIMSLFEDRMGTVWVGTFGGGLCAYQRERDAFTCYRHDPDDPKSLSSSRATAIAEDGLGGLWIGTDGGGLNYFERATGTFRHFRHDPENPSSLSADQLYALHADDAGALWIGTAGGGLDRIVMTSLGLEGVRFRNVSRTDGLSSDVIYGIVSDESGVLWLTSNNGLMRFNPRTGSVKTFHRNHGLQGDEFNFGAYHRGPDGRVYFGGPNGVNAFYPADIEESRQPPPVVLTAFETQGRLAPTDVPYPLIQSIDLGYEDEVVTFEFAALDFTAPEKNQYRYRLEGFDRGWNSLGNKRRVTYTNLDADQYLFRVQAANSDGVWNEQGLSIPLKVTSPPWQTKWAYATYVMFGLLLVANLFRAQQRRLVREAENNRRLEIMVDERTLELEQRNRDLHDMSEAKSEFLARMSHEIRTPMNGVMGMTELLRRTRLTSTQKRFAETIQSSATSLLALINDILDLSKIEAGKLELESREFDLTLLLEETVDLLSVEAFDKGLELLCQVPAHMPMLRGDPLRLRQVLTNLIGNAIKYTSEGEVFVRAGIEHTATGLDLTVEVRDTGVGIGADSLATIFDPFAQGHNGQTGPSGTGLGLSIANQLVDLMGGELKVDSIEGAGSNFHFTIPFEVAGETVHRVDGRGGRQPRVVSVTSRRSTREALEEKLAAWNVRLLHCADIDDLSRMLDGGRADDFDVLLIDTDAPLGDGFDVLRRHRKALSAAGVRVAVMTPPTLLDSCDRHVPTLIDAVLRKPVRESVLRDLLFDTMSSTHAERNLIPVTRIEGRILVVEDNVVNQAVVCGMLRELGCEAVVADNGRLAVQRAACEDFDLILMDRQMPEMDGFEATALIRQREGDGDRIPIVALTANAIEGERERCIEAGMDDYLSKPFTFEQLGQVLRKNLRTRRPRVVGTSGIASVSGMAEAPLIDEAALAAIRAVGESDQLLEEVVALYIDSSADLLGELQIAAEAQDGPAVQAIAHSLKSSSYNVGARGLGDLCRRLEDAGGRGDWPAMRALLDAVVTLRPQVVAKLEACIGRSAA